MKHHPGLTLVCAALLALAGSRANATMPPRSGPVPQALTRAFADGGFALPPIAAPGAVAPVRGHAVWRVPVILVSYSDSALVYGSQAFQQGLFDTTGQSPSGSVFDYYQWASGGQVRVVPTVVATVTLAYPRAYYGNNFWGLNYVSTPQNDYGLVRDALVRSSPQIDWSLFDVDRDWRVDVLWVVHAGIGGEASQDRNDLWSVSSQMSNFWYNGEAWETPTPVPGSPTQHIVVDRFSVLPELSGFVPGQISEIGVYCHEFGHALGLPDLYDTATNGYPNAGHGNWSLMSTGVYGGNGTSPESPVRPGAWCEQYLGWIATLRPALDTTLVMVPVEHGGPILDLCFQGQPTSDHFLVENRRRDGYDRNLPGEGLLVYHANESAIALRLAGNLVNSGPDPALVLLEADGRRDLMIGNNYGDASDPFPGALARTFLFDGGPPPDTRTFAGNPSNLGLFEMTAPGPTGEVDVYVQVRAPGWQPAADRTLPPFDPVTGHGTAVRAAVDPGGDLSTVGSELRSGRTQVVLRERIGEAWQPPAQVSQTTGHAVDPAMAALPGGDLAVVWSDSRAGGSRIYYRARIRGAWTAEQPLGNLPGDAYNPAIGADSRGLIQVAWLQIEAGLPQIRMMSFAYTSPFGHVYSVTSPSDRPDAPAIAVGRRGASVVVWADVATGPPSLWFVHFHPDSGLGVRQRLADPTGKSPQSVHALMDSSGALHTLWIASGPGTSEVHYQRRPRNAAPFPPDSALVSVGGVVQEARLALDPSGGAHLVYQSAAGSVSQLYYKRGLPGNGWDQWATDITSVGEGSAQDPLLAAGGRGQVTVLFTRDLSGSPHLMERRRTLDTPLPITAVRDAPLARPGSRLAARPNPLRPGQALELVAVDLADGPRGVELFDLAGRRVGAAALAGEGRLRSARFGRETTAGWRAGVYFARLEGDRGPAARVVVLR